MHRGRRSRAGWTKKRFKSTIPPSLKQENFGGKSSKLAGGEKAVEELGGGSRLSFSCHGKRSKNPREMETATLVIKKRKRKEEEEGSCQRVGGGAFYNTHWMRRTKNKNLAPGVFTPTGGSVVRNLLFTRFPKKLGRGAVNIRLDQGTSKRVWTKKKGPSCKNRKTLEQPAALTIFALSLERRKR